jgi:hypothetical protein
MGCLKQPVAREANIKDRANDNFWAGRFQSVPLEDEAAVAACGAYVNLDPILADRFERLSEAEYTSAYLRIQDEAASGGETRVEETRGKETRGKETRGKETRGKETRGKETRGKETRGKETRGEVRARSVWLQPVRVETAEVCEPRDVGAGRRASNDGFLRMTFEEQREVIESLLQFEYTVRDTGNEDLQPELPKVLERLGVSVLHWSDTVQAVRIRFQRELQIRARMIAEARELLPQGHSRGVGASSSGRSFGGGRSYRVGVNDESTDAIGRSADDRSDRPGKSAGS